MPLLDTHTGADVFSDIHGHCDELEALLDTLGYRRSLRRGWHHPDGRLAVIPGDTIDRGPRQVDTVKLVRQMVEDGAAVASMGNHELNAILWATADPVTGRPLRVHGSRNRYQHQAFLDAVGEGSALHQELVDWFRTLPLWLDFGDLRAVHACWHEPSIAALDGWLDEAGRLTEAGIVEVGRKGTAAYTAAEILIKGQEMDLPAGCEYLDKDGILRKRSRVRWWRAGAQPLHEALLLPDGHGLDIPAAVVEGPELHGYDHAAPCFVGHYWMSGTPAPLTDNVACVDYSVAKGGSLCAYRWDGEAVLQADKFVVQAVLGR